mmetsp:Transcript_27528/g.53916  ORF Transcript_27528/g.53916 Transcript_27528/m.53916 type:complete len:640 (-) Transcript_27528:16-1935(-)
MLGPRALQMMATSVFMAALCSQTVAAAWEDALDHGSVRGFPSFAEADRLLQEWLRRYPHVLAQHTIGSSFMKRPIHAYVLGKQQKQLQGRPQVLITSLMHAREPASLTVLLYFLGHMLELYGRGDPLAVYVIHAREIWFVPFVNVDGYMENEGLRVKQIRKNRRPTCGRASNGGVDINRNFAVHWKKDFKGCDEEFQGSAPFSEPETQAIKKICEENKFKVALNYHSFGGMLTHPFNWAKTPQLPKETQRIYDEIALAFGWQKFGPAIKTVGYTAVGESDDWMYGAQGIISMSPEVGPEYGDFWPPVREIKGINSRNFVRATYVVRKAGFEPTVSWEQRPALGSGTEKLSAGAPRNILELKLGNRGLTPSLGHTLLVILAGVVLSPNSVAVTAPGSKPVRIKAEDGTEVPARLLNTTGSASTALVFSLRPLAARSVRSLKLLASRAVEPDGVRRMRLCLAEGDHLGWQSADGGPSILACHCVEAAIPVPPSLAGVSWGPKPATGFVLSSDSTAANGDVALCSLAARSAKLEKVPEAVRVPLKQAEAASKAEAESSTTTTGTGNATVTGAFLAPTFVSFAVLVCMAFFLMFALLQRRHAASLGRRLPKASVPTDVEAEQIPALGRPGEDSSDGIAGATVV